MIFAIVNEHTERETVTVEVSTVLLATLIEDACRHQEEITGDSSGQTRAQARILRHIQNSQYNVNQYKEPEVDEYTRGYNAGYVNATKNVKEFNKVVEPYPEPEQKYFGPEDDEEVVTPEPKQRSYAEYMADLTSNHNPRYEDAEHTVTFDDVEHTVTCEECERIAKAQADIVLKSMKACECYTDPHYTHPAPHREGMDTDGQSDEYPLAGA